MTSKLPKGNKLKSLNQQIVIAEQQLIYDQRCVVASSSQLFKELQRKLTTPSSLLLFGCFGFLCGELNHYRTPDTCNHEESSLVTKNNVWSFAIITIKFIQSLYTAMPLILSIKLYFESSHQNKAP